MYIDKETGDYPLNTSQIQERHPLTMMAHNLMRYALVERSEPPEHNADTHKPVEIEPVETEGVWRQQWSVVPLSAEELAELQRQREEAARITVSRRQGMLSLFLLKGIKDSDVEDAINTISDPDLRYITKVNWQGASEFISDSETVHKLAEILELSEQDLKELFQRAKEL